MVVRVWSDADHRFLVLRMNARRRPPGIIYRIQAITRPLADPCTNMNETGTETGTETRSRSWPLAEDSFNSAGTGREAVL
jgi:hypothetical protein